MTKLPKSLADWPSDCYSKTLKKELESLASGILPLQLGVSRGGYVDDDNVSVTVFGAIDGDQAVRAHVGVFFTEVIGGCSCGDDPVAENAYCELYVYIDKTSMEAVFEVVSQ